MKWVILAIVVILVAPTIASRLEALDPEKRDNPESGPTTQRRRGLAYRAVRRFGPRRAFIGFVLILVILVAVAYILVRKV